MGNINSPFIPPSPYKILSHLRRSDFYTHMSCRGFVLRTSPPAYKLSSLRDYLQPIKTKPIVCRDNVLLARVCGEESCRTRLQCLHI